MRKPGYRNLIASAALLVVTAFEAAAQDSLQGDTLTPLKDLEKTGTGFRNGSLIVAPIPINNPTIGTGLMLGAGYLFSIDPGSDPSGIGLGAMKTDNGSEGYGLIGRLNFGNGKWKVRAGWGRADLVYDFYTMGTPVEISQKGFLGQFGASYYLTDAISIGLDLGYTESELSSFLAVIPPSLAPDLGIATLTTDLVVGYDTRDDTIYPTSGVNAALRVGRGAVSSEFGIGNVNFGSDRKFNRSIATFDFYHSVFDTKVLAGRVTACGVNSDTPFFLACMLGSTDAFRGYPSTQYIGNALTSIQLEYRGRIGESRFGYAGFAGVGAVADSFAQLKNSDVLAAGGLGLRYRVSRKFPADLSVDVAVNSDGDTTTYVYVGQRF